MRTASSWRSPAGRTLRHAADLSLQCGCLRHPHVSSGRPQLDFIADKQAAGLWLNAVTWRFAFGEGRTGAADRPP
ncbi:hypothetical protein BN434_3332 [Erwinia amylovora CFBP 2585]|nr:hypothetical protein BN434_3332 [Erwinia amylovora CFBP 2585]